MSLYAYQYDFNMLLVWNFSNEFWMNGNCWELLMHSVWCAEGKSSWLEQEGSERTRFELEIFVYFLTNFYFMQISRFCWFFIINFGSIDRVAQQIALPTTRKQQRIHLLFESTHEWYKSSIKHSSYVSHFSCSCVYVNILNLMFFSPSKSNSVLFSNLLEEDLNFSQDFKILDFWWIFSEIRGKLVSIQFERCW
jgi:hypothetical protein